MAGSSSRRVTLALIYLSSIAFASPLSLTSRDIDSNLLANINFYEQFAAAAYCNFNNNLTSSFGNQVSCPTGNCPLISATNTTTLYEFDKSLRTDVTGFISLTPDSQLIVLSFRGSKSVRNFLTDGDFLLVDSDICDNCLVHDGFWNSWLEARDGILSAMQTAVASSPSYKIVVTGHSLGGAIAGLAAAELRNMGVGGDEGVALYTYGAPRIGQKALSDYITNQNGGNYRVTHADDPVPRLPPIFLSYAHISPEYWITTASNVVPGVGDIQVLQGDVNTKGNAGTSGFDVNAHLWYMNSVSACSPAGFEFKL